MMLHRLTARALIVVALLAHGVLQRGRVKGQGALNSDGRLQLELLVALKGHILHGNAVQAANLLAVQFLEEQLDIGFHDAGKAGGPPFFVADAPTIIVKILRRFFMLSLT
jgi:hypothetical protein